jgi:hypothetical protein
MIHDGSAARKPTGNSVPRVIGTSPKMSTGTPLPDHPGRSVHNLARVDPTLEEREERTLVAVVRRRIHRPRD